MARPNDPMRNMQIPAIALIGQESVGKSSLENRLLRHNIMPTGARRTTMHKVRACTMYAAQSSYKLNNQEYTLEDLKSALRQTFIGNRGRISNQEDEIAIAGPEYRSMTYEDLPGLTQDSENVTNAFNQTLAATQAESTFTILVLTSRMEYRSQLGYIFVNDHPPSNLAAVFISHLDQVGSENDEGGAEDGLLAAIDFVDADALRIDPSARYVFGAAEHEDILRQRIDCLPETAKARLDALESNGRLLIGIEPFRALLEKITLDKIVPQLENMKLTIQTEINALRTGQSDFRNIAIAIISHVKSKVFEAAEQYLSTVQKDVTRDIDQLYSECLKVDDIQPFVSQIQDHILNRRLVPATSEACVMEHYYHTHVFPNIQAAFSNKPMNRLPSVSQDFHRSLLTPSNTLNSQQLNSTSLQAWIHSASAAAQACLRAQFLKIKEALEFNLTLHKAVVLTDWPKPGPQTSVNESEYSFCLQPGADYDLLVHTMNHRWAGLTDSLVNHAKRPKQEDRDFVENCTRKIWGFVSQTLRVRLFSSRLCIFAHFLKSDSFDGTDLGQSVTVALSKWRDESDREDHLRYDADRQAKIATLQERLQYVESRLRALVNEGHP